MPDPTSPAPPSGVGAESTSSVPVSRGAAGTDEPTYRIVLPYGRPPLNWNHRLNRWAKAAVVAQIRKDVGWLAVHHQIPPADRITVQLFYATGRRGKFDPMNFTATSKPAIDALVDIGVVVDDDLSHVHELTPEILLPPEPGPRCWLIVKVHHDTGGTA